MTSFTVLVVTLPLLSQFYSPAKKIGSSLVQWTLFRVLSLLFVQNPKQTKNCSVEYVAASRIHEHCAVSVAITQPISIHMHCVSLLLLLLFL